MKKVIFIAYGMEHTRYVLSGTDQTISDHIFKEICEWAEIVSIKVLSEQKWLRIFSSPILKNNRRKKENSSHLNYKYSREILFLEGF